MDLPNSLRSIFKKQDEPVAMENVPCCDPYAKADSIKLRKRITDAFPEREFIVRVYEALGNYYQVAVGAGLATLTISVCTSFAYLSNSFLQAHHALKILELAGYIEYTEEIDLRSRVRF